MGDAEAKRMRHRQDIWSIRDVDSASRPTPAALRIVAAGGLPAVPGFRCRDDIPGASSGSGMVVWSTRKRRRVRMPRRGVVGVPGRALRGALLLALAAYCPIALAQVECIGDCNGDDRVAVNELVTLVNISLGTLSIESCPLPPCPQIDVVCAMGAVNNALRGCPAQPVTAGIVFNGEENRLNAYEAGPHFTKQTVIPSADDVPGGVGRDLNAQICFTRGPQGQVRFIGGEDTNQGGQHASAGWGYFELTGERVG